MKYKNIDAEEFAALKGLDNHMVLDVRTPPELSEGEIPGHIMINFFDRDFRQKIAKLDRSNAYLVYCRSGGRSGQACAALAEMGFAGLYNLQGGIQAWNSLKPAG